MKRYHSIVLIIVVLIASVPVFGAYHTSVPLDHRVYTVLENAEVRGLIDRQMDVRPYSAHTILTLLDELSRHTNNLSVMERNEVESLAKQIDTSYGTEPSPIKDILSTGYYRSYNEDKKIGTSLGATFSTQQTGSLSLLEYDSRNVGSAFIKGDLGTKVSYVMTIGATVDHLNPHVFLPPDFTIPGEGFYNRVSAGDRYLRVIPSDGFYNGFVLSPELAVSLFDNNLRIRWGSIKRDWGPGLNNLLLSSNARPFDGIEIQVDFASWLHYAVVTGSLGKFALRELDGKPFFSDDAWTDKPYYRFDNNFSTHRVEVDFFKNLTFGIQESVVWQKRFELGYLNPLTIYMFQQNNLGDIDEMIAGVDLTYTWPEKARFYAAVATTEMNDVSSIKKIFTYPRNMLAYQAGVVIPIPVGSFSTLTAQWTFLSPFFYAHYPIMEQTGELDKTDGQVTASQHENLYKVTSAGGKITKVARVDSKGNELWHVDTNDSATSWLSPDGRTEIKDKGGKYYIYETTSETAYVNKGENLGYPLNPNSQEFLVQLDLGLPKGWTAQAQLKYQVRSDQYGYTVEQYMDYGNMGRYEAKAFWKHVFEHTVSVKVGGSKRFEGTPIEVNAFYQLWGDWNRMTDDTAAFDGIGATISPDWPKPTFNHVVQIGAKIYF
jgi:hypothetical protein